MLIDSRRHNGPTLQARLARSLALLVLLLAAAARPALAAPIVFVQSNSATPQSPQTTVTVSYTAAQTLGNLNVVVVGWNNSTAAVSSVTDSRGNAYAVAAAPVVQSGTASQVIYYAKNISAAGAGANTVTVTFSTAAAFPDIRIAEYSGLDTVSPLDVSVGAQGTTTSTSNSGPVTTTNANDLLVGANLVQSITTGAGTGFTSRGITADGDILEDRIVTVTGSYNATAALDKVQAWIMQMVAFRAAGSGTPAPSITSLNPTSGLVGASVTITGANFGASQGTSTVTFNGATATPTSWSGTSITTPVPIGATTGNVVVTVGGVASNGVSFTVGNVSPILFVQTNSASPQATQTPVTVTYTGAQSAGNLNVVIVSWNDSTAIISSVADSIGNGYTVAAAPVVQTSTASQAIYYAKNIAAAAAGANTVTVNFSVGARHPDIRIAEYSGVDPLNPLDTSVGAQGNTATSDSGPVTTTNANDILIGANVVQSISTGPGAGYTNRGITVDGDILEDQIVSTTGSYNATATLDQVQLWIMQMVAFRAAVSGGSPVPNIASLNPTSGPVGSSVTMTGSNFGASQGTSTVKFNGTTATPTSWSATSISVPVPAGARDLGRSEPERRANFGSAQGTSTVNFNGAVATPTSWSPTSITVSVPTSAVTGNVVVIINGLASNGVIFTVIPPPSITSLSPTSGPVGTQVTITGTNFGSAQGTSTVTFNGTSATPTFWSTTGISVQVPAAATTGNVVVTVNGIPSNGVIFTLPPQNISSLSPTSGPVTTVVTITGTNFGAAQGASTVAFNGTIAGPTSWSSTSIIVPVPSGATTGNVVVTVGGIASNGLLFTVTTSGPGPGITSLSPTLGPVGTSVRIIGSNLGASQGTSTVTFSGITATPTSWSATDIFAPVPSGATTGNVVVTVGGVASNGINFTVVPPSISSLSPNFGLAGTSVTIFGTNFGATQGTSTVTFNGTIATPTSWSVTSIVAPVPTGATNGNVVVTVGGLASNGVNFTVGPPPNISLLSPTSGPAGTPVTITGTNFGASQGAGFVRFSGVVATPTSWSATSISVPVPAGAPTGNDLVDVTTAGGVGSNQVVFTITPPPSITGLNPSSGIVGTSVVIAGANFGVAQGSSTVTFNGTTGTPTAWSATSITVPVPAGATTGNVVVTVGGLASNGSNFTVTTVTGIRLAQHTSKDAGTTNSSTLAFPSSNTAGNFIAVVIRAGRAGQILTVSDTRGNSYRTAIQFNVTTDTPNGDTLGVFYAENIAGGANTVTVADSINGSTLRFAILEYSGVGLANSLDVVSTGQGTSATANSGNALTTANGDLLLGGILTGNPATYTAATGYTIEDRVPASPNTKLATEDQIQATAGTISAGVTFSASDSWGAGLAAFKAASGGGTSGPMITNLNPTSGVVGTSVTITGTNFGASQGTSTVTFNGTPATPTSWGATSIAVPVPTGATTGNIVVTVGGTASNGVTFNVTVPPPNITSLNPTSGVVGTSVIIAGANFGATQGTSTVKFNGTTATPTAWSATSITAPVPIGATTGNVVVTVGGVASNGISFSVTIPTPSITNLNPASGVIGTSVTITGTNFGASQGTSTVTFNGLATTPTSWSATSIAAPVPNGSTTGNVIVTASGVASNGLLFTVTSPGPSLTSLGLTQGPAGATVTITGANFGATQGTSTVTFNGTVGAPSAWSDTSIDVTVPAGATTGNVVVTVGGIASNGLPFTITPPPNISAAAPSSSTAASSSSARGWK